MSLEGIFRKVLKESGLDSFSHTFSEEKTPHLIEGGMNVKGFFEVQIKVDPEIEKRLAEILKKDNVKGSVDELMHTVVNHEHAHWKVCPFDIEFLEELLAGTSKGLTEAGFSQEKLTPQRVWAKANETMDIICNIVLAYENPQKEKWRLGRGIKYLVEANQKIELGGVKFGGDGYPIDYGLFVDAQMRMYNPDFRWMAPKYTKEYKKITGIIEKAIAIFSDDATAKKAMQGPLDKFDLQRISEKVEQIFYFDKVTKQKVNNWYEIAREYAKLTGHYQTEPTVQYMTQSGEGEGDEEQQEGEDGDGKDGKDKKDKKKGKGKKDKDKKDGKDGKGKDGKDQAKLNSAFHQVDPEIIKKVLQVSISKGRDESEMAYASQYEIYKAGLESRAQDLIIDYTSKGEHETRLLTISHLSSEKVDPIAMKKFRWGRTKCIITPEDEEWWLYEKRLPLQVEGDFNEGIGSLIDILFIVDKSGSMGSGHACGKSSYELVEEAIAASIKFLKNEQKAYYQNFALLLFGERDNNIFTGWKSYYELDGFFKLLYEHHNPNDGETILNPNALNLAVRDAKDQFLMLMVSDGELHNREQAFYALKGAVDAGNFLTLFQIGGESELSQSVKKAGFGQVHDNFDRPEYLQGKAIKRIDQIFGAQY